MPGFRQPLEKTLQARALTDPQPRFVSIVQAGANQTPIRSIKVDVVNVEDNPMTNKIAALKADGHEVKRMTFQTGEDWPDEAAVRKFLDDGGYDSTSLKAIDGGFEVVNDGDEFTDDVRVIKVSESLTVEIGALVTPDVEGEDAETKAKNLANNAGSAITNVKVIGAKGEGGGEGEGEAEGEGTESANKQEDDGGEGEGVLTHGLDGSLKAIRKRAKPKEDDQGGDGSSTDGDEDQFTGETALKADETVKKTVISYNSAHSDGTSKASEGEAWNGPEERKKADVDDLLVMSAWREDKSREDLVKGDFKFPHHKAGDKHSVVLRGVNAAMAVLQGARGGADIPEGERQGVFRHLARHLRDDFDREPPELSSREEFEANLAGDGSTTLEIPKPEDGTVIKTEAIMAKFDEFAAHFSDGMTLEKVMDDANDGFPPGLEMVILAAVMAMRNNFLAGDLDAVRQVGTDLGEVAAVLGSTFAKVERAEDRQKLTDMLSGEFANMGWPEGASKENATKDGGVGDHVLAPVLTQLTEAIKAMVEGLGEVKAKQVEQTEATAGLTDRVSKVESLKQTRKGADDGDVGAAVETKEDPIADLALRGALGISRRAKSGRFGH